MRSRDAQIQENGFFALLPHAAEHVDDLLAAFDTEQDHGLRRWLLELVAAARSPKALPLLSRQLASADEGLRHRAARGLSALATPEARAALYEARAWSFAGADETARFHALLDELAAKRKRR